MIPNPGEMITMLVTDEKREKQQDYGADIAVLVLGQLPLCVWDGESEISLEDEL